MEKTDGQRLSDYHNNVMQREKSNKMERFTFKPGDLVKYAPYGDSVFELQLWSDNPERIYRFSINTSDGLSLFTEDGRCGPNHTNPLITLVSRPKRKVTKVIERWANVYCYGVGGGHDTKEAADENAGITRIACVKLTGSYEIEE